MSVNPLQGVDPQALGAGLRETREARGWTQQQVADRLGMARTTLVAIEKGQRRLKPEELTELAEIYGVKVSALLQRGAPAEGFGGCTNTGACEYECPKHVSMEHVARLNWEFVKAKLLSRD